MNISKEQFVLIINSAIEQIERDNEIAKSLDIVVRDGDNRELVFVTPFVEQVIEALDYDKIISWWFWDGPDCGKNAETFAIYSGDPDDPDSKLWRIKTASDLYDYMMEAKK